MEHKSIYELSFRATRTDQNGKEQQLTKAVLVDAFRSGKHTTPEQQREIAQGILREQLFYDLVYLETKVKKVH